MVSKSVFKSSVAKHHSAEFITEALGLLRIGGVAETLGKLEKLLLLALLSRDPVLDESRRVPFGLAIGGFALVRLRPILSRSA